MSRTIKLDNRFYHNPKVVAAGPLGLSLYVAGLCYCNQHMTNGFIPWDDAQKLLEWEYFGPLGENGHQGIISICISCGMAGVDVDSEYVIGLLLASGAWEMVDDGYKIHDCQDF